MLNKTIDTANGTKQQDIHFKKLHRLFLLECQCNMKLLDTTKWKGVSDGFKKEILKNLKTDAAQAIHCFVEQDNISWLSGKDE